MILRLLISTAGMLLVLGAVLFASAGSLAWPGAWAFLVEMGVRSVWLGLWLARHDRGLLAERLGTPVGDKAEAPWGRLFIAAALVSVSAWLAFIGWGPRWS